MNSNKDPNKKHYFALGGKMAFEHDLTRLTREHENVPVTIWIKGEDSSLAEIYELQSYNSQEHCLHLIPTGMLMTKINGSTKTGKDVLVKIPVEDKLNYFTGGRLLFNKSDLSYKLILDQDIYRSQARHSFRLQASSVIKISLDINQHHYQARDISVGGLSLIVKNVDIERFIPQSIIQHAVLKFNMHQYSIPQLKVMSISEDETSTKSDRVLKVGLAFLDLPVKTRDDLYIRISTESRGQEFKNEFDNVMTKKAPKK